MEVCERSSCVHGYHIYKDIWEPDAIIGKELQCEREPDTNRSDRYVQEMKQPVLLSCVALLAQDSGPSGFGSFRLRLKYSSNVVLF